MLREIFTIISQSLCGKTPVEISREQLEQLERHVRQSVQDCSTASFADVCKAILGKVASSAAAAELSRIPDKGSLLVVANHPTYLDGMLLADMITARRSDCLFIVKEHPFVRSVLRAWPKAEEGACFVDKNNRRLTMRSIRRATRHLDNGGAVVIFPAGRNQALPCWYKAPVETEWQPFAGKLAKLNETITVPIHIGLQTSRISLMLERISVETKRVGHLLQLQNLMARKTPVPVAIGKPIPRKFWGDQDYRTIAAQLREITLELPLGREQRIDRNHRFKQRNYG